MRLIEAPSSPASPTRVREPTRLPLRVGLVQHRWHAHAETLEAELGEGIRLAAEAGARLVFLPELTLSKYPGHVPATGTPKADAEPLTTGPTFAFAAIQARLHNVIVHASLFEKPDDDDAPLEPTGQGQDLPGLVDRFRTAGLPVRAEGLRLEPPADTGLRLALYRVVQESLTNVLRHAPGTAHVDVELNHYPDRWEVTVADHGGVVPAPEAGGAGLGLVGMQERVELLGGSVEAGPWEHGWRVHVVIPDQEA